MDSVEELLNAMSPEFPAQLGIELNKTLLEKDFSQKFIDELITTAVLVNYGQRPDIQTFVGNVAIAGAESGLWTVKGGNFKGLFNYCAIILGVIGKVTVHRTLNECMFQLSQQFWSPVVLSKFFESSLAR